MPVKYFAWPTIIWPRGVSNRNAAIEWILKRVEMTGDDSGHLYFADDDNIYDLRLFKEVICYSIISESFL